MSKETEHQLLALKSLVETRQDWLFRFAYMRIGRREDAEDLVQEVFLSLFKTMQKQGNIDNIEGYLIRSITNACMDYHRRKRRTLIPLDSANELKAPEEDRNIHEEYLRIARLLDNLPPEQAEIVRMKCYDSLTFKQIAEALDIPEATAKSRYRYAIQHIQKSLTTPSKAGT